MSAYISAKSIFSHPLSRRSDRCDVGIHLGSKLKSRKLRQINFFTSSCPHAAVANPPGDLTAHLVQREQQGMRAGGYGMLLAAGTVDELLYNEIGNEVILIKYLDQFEQKP
jgi:hypothetical protein